MVKILWSLEEIHFDAKRMFKPCWRLIWESIVMYLWERLPALSLLNEVMLTLGCTMPTLDDLSKLKRLDVRAIDLRCTQALMATLPVFLTSGRFSTYSYKGSGGGSARFKAFPSFAD